MTEFKLAQESLRDLQESDSPVMRRQIVRTICSSHDCHLWFSVFKDYPSILQEVAKLKGKTLVISFGNYELRDLGEIEAFGNI